MRPAEGPDLEFVLEDVPGGAFYASTMNKETLAGFESSQGIVYLFDPFREFLSENSGNFDYFDVLINKLSQRLSDNNGLVRGRLPHCLAICVTKFDDPQTFALGASHFSGNLGKAGYPTISSREAKDIFDSVCARSKSGTGPFLRDSIVRHFHPERTKYFLTSSLGVYANEGGSFATEGTSNLDVVDGASRIRGLIRPFNVLEPLVQTARKVKTDKWA
jgi:hypothetical protein